MIKPNGLQFEHLQFSIASPFLTQPRETGSTIVNIHTKEQVKVSKSGLAFTNISFTPNQQALRQSQACKRIHGRQTIKNLGQAKLILAKQRKKQRVQNNSKDSIFTNVKQQIEKSQKKVLKSKNRSQRSSIQQISILNLDTALKSIEGNRKLKKRTTKPNYERFSIELSSSKFNQNKTSVCCSVLEIEAKSFENINKKIQVCEQKQKEQTGFYKKLKNKVQRAMNKLQNTKNPNKQNLSIQGFKAYQHSPKSVSYQRSLTDRLTPRTTLSRTGLQFKEHRYRQRSKRPKTARASTSQRKQIEYLSARSNELFAEQKQYKRSVQSDNQTQKQFFVPKNHKTLRHVSPIGKQTKYAFSKGQIRKEKIKEKLLNILVECENQTEQSQSLQTGLSVFESFANKMSYGLSNLSKQLQSSTPINQYTQF